MTAPFVSMLKDYVLKAPSAGSMQTMTITSPPSGGSVYALIPEGSAQVAVSWDGAASVEVYYGPSANWNDRRLVGTIPAGPRNTARTFRFPIAADTSSYVVFLRANCDTTDLNYRAGVTVISQRIA